MSKRQPEKRPTARKSLFRRADSGQRLNPRLQKTDAQKSQPSQTLRGHSPERFSPKTALMRDRQRSSERSQIVSANSVGSDAKPSNSRRSRRQASARLSRQPRPRSPRNQKSRAVSPVMYVFRLLIFGVGTAVVAGIAISMLSPLNRDPADASQTDKTEKARSKTDRTTPVAWTLEQEFSPLKTQVEKLAAKNPNLDPGVFVIDLDTNNYLDLKGETAFSAASTIKVPILVAFFQAVDAGKIRLDDLLTLEADFVAEGSGEMQGHPLGTQYTALETATKMIAISDNTATNMLIARLDGPAKLNQRFQSWGLQSTKINNPLADLEGTNTTSPKDLARIMALVNKGKLISLRSRDRLLSIMRQTRTRTLLPPGLGQGATIAHKTGDIGSLVADVGLIDMPNGKRYLAAVMVTRPHNDSRAQALIRKISKSTYQYLNQPSPPTKPSTVTPTPSPQSATSQ